MYTIFRKREGKPVSFSAIDDRKIKLFPEDMSPHGVIYGSRILDIVDGYAQEVAEKHAETKCKTLGIDYVRFFSQARRGDIFILYSSVNRAWNKSLEVGIKVIAEDFRSLEKKHILSAYFTFEIATDSNCSIDYVICETPDQKRRYIEAQKRKAKNYKYHYIYGPNNQ